MEIINKIFRIAYCVGTIGNPKDNVEGATRICKISTSFIFFTILIIFTRIVYDLSGIKIMNNYTDFIFMAIFVYISWFRLAKYFEKKVLIAQKHVRKHYSSKRIKVYGICFSIIIVFGAPAMVLFFGVLLLNNFANW